MVRAAHFHISQHLQDNELTFSFTGCPVCGTNRQGDVVFLLQKRPDVKLLRCPKCHGCYASPMPTPDALNRYYAGYYTDSSDDRVTFHNPHRFARHLKNSLLRNGFLKRESYRVLDFGGGDGSLAISLMREVLKKGEIVVVDYELSKQVESPEFTVHTVKDLQRVTGEFDLIIASAILEHVPALNETLEMLFYRLKTDGLFYARVPFTIPFKRLFPWLDFTFPAHVHDLGPAFWNSEFLKEKYFVEIVSSRAALVETNLRLAPMRTLLAYLFKLPSRIEELFCGPVIRRPVWPWVGGWEILLKKHKQVHHDTFQ